MRETTMPSPLPSEARRRVLVSVAIIMAALALAPPDATAQFGRLFRGSKDTEFQPYQNASRKLVMDYPKKDWQMKPGSGPVVVTFTQKKSEATVVVEYEPLEHPYDPKDITQLVADLEVDRIKGQTPQAANFKTAIRDEPGRRLVVIDFTRPSAASGGDRLRQYAVAAGNEMYRITCTSSTEAFARYDPVFQHMIGSFKIGSPPASTPGR
jgi:hypothetical protein